MCSSFCTKSLCANLNWIQDDPILWFLKFKWTFLTAQYHRAELKCFYGEILEAWHVLCFPVAVFFMWHFHFNLQILHIWMRFTALNSNILPWRLYCSKWQVLCIVLLIKQQILKYCCGRLVPDFLYKWNAQQCAQYLEEFAISCEYPVFAFIYIIAIPRRPEHLFNIRLSRVRFYISKLNTGCNVYQHAHPFIFVTSSVCFASLDWNGINYWLSSHLLSLTEILTASHLPFISFNGEIFTETADNSL